MRRNRRREDWYDVIAYLLLSLGIVLIILEIFLGHRGRLIVLTLVLLSACLGLLLICLAQRRTVMRDRELLCWMKEGDLDDRSILSESLQRELQPFFEALDRRTSGESLSASLEYAALQDQINPHFLYNTLDAIRSQALAAGQNEIADMTGKMSRFYRYSIKDRGDLVPIWEEIRNVQDYFSIQKYRFEDRFSLEIHEEEPEIQNYYIPKMTFQPIVENSLYHGLEIKKGAGKITLRLSLLGKSIQILIRDDGKGMNEEQLAQIRERLDGHFPEEDARGNRTGIAIYNVNRRIKLLFGPDYGLQIFSVPGMGTDVEVRIPLVDEENRGRLTRRM